MSDLNHWERDVPMELQHLLRQFDPQLDIAAVPNVEIRGIREDSRLVKPGDLFIARPGTRADGAKFVADAAQRGAVAVVTAAPLPDCPLPQITLADPARAVSRLAHLFHGEPSKSVSILGVTGTNGKTTTAYLWHHLLTKLHGKCGLIGTVEIDDGNTRRQATMTTPGAVEIAELMAAMRDNGCRSCAMEVSSHALDQGRVAAVQFAGAAFTNLTRDHLDYHKTMKRYGAAKAMLFEMLTPNAVAVVNADDPACERMVHKCRARLVRFSIENEAEYRASDLNITSDGSQFTLHTPKQSLPMHLRLVGRHNIANALTALSLAVEVFGLDVAQVAQALSDAAGAPGRLQQVQAGQPFAVLVDYAHTDDALQNVLKTLRPLTRGKLRCLFGCGGDRDRTKRPLMAKAAAKLADAVYVTSDNPRTENAGAILDEIMTGFPRKLAKPIVVEIDRRKAINRILHDAQSGDVVLLAGKGHEDYQIIGTTKHHFDDIEEARNALNDVQKA